MQEISTFVILKATSTDRQTRRLHIFTIFAFIWKCQLHYDFGGKSREVFKVVKPMDAFLLHLYWPLKDCDQPYWATGQPSSMRPRFLFHATVLILDGPTDCPNKSSSWTMYVSGSCGLTFEPRFADIRLIRMLRYYGQLSSSLDKAVTFYSA